MKGQESAAGAGDDYLVSLNSETARYLGRGRIILRSVKEKSLRFYPPCYQFGALLPSKNRK